MDQHVPAISVIIPTYNGAHRISNTLDAIINQSVTPDEVIVVIDGSTDSTGQVIEYYSHKFKNLKIINQPNMGRAGVRNTGAKNVVGEILIFYDDDMRPCTDSIARHIDFHQNYSNAICGGNQLEDLEVMKSDIQLYKAHLSRKWTAKYNEGLNLMNLQNLFLTAANMSISKVLFDSLGGFNEKLSDAEDHELAVRAYEKGIPVYFDKSNIAWHDDFINCEKYINRRKQYHKVMQKKNTEFQYKYGLWSRMEFYLFSRPFWVYLADHTRVLLLLPKKLRYGLYSLIIWRSAGIG